MMEHWSGDGLSPWACGCQPQGSFKDGWQPSFLDGRLPSLQWSDR